MTALPPPLPAAAEPRSWLAAKLVELSNTLVRDIVVDFSAAGHQIAAERVTALRVAVGMTVRAASLFSRQYQHTLDTQAKSAALAARLPKVVVRSDPFVSEDEVTESWHPSMPAKPPPVVHVRGPGVKRGPVGLPKR